MSKKNNKNKKSNILTTLLLIIFSPILLLVAVLVLLSLAGITIFETPKNKKEYKSSRYFLDLGKKFSISTFYSHEYRFYNGAIKRGLPFKYYMKESSSLEYFIHDGTIYLFPDFTQIYLNEDGAWEINYDGDLKSFTEEYSKKAESLENPEGLPVKILVERSLVPIPNLSTVEIPSELFITMSYETVFENEESPLKMIIPQNSKELYEMMLQTPELCGSFEYDPKNDKITWLLYHGFTLDLSIYESSCCFEIFKNISKNFSSPLTHWHPENHEFYDEICKIGKRGNVLVIRTSIFGEAVKYMGCAEDCPYSQGKRSLLGKTYYLKAE